MLLTLQRLYLPEATIGFIPQLKIHTIELPWRNNSVGFSCIPEGRYMLKLRRSPVVERVTKGRYLYGWEVLDVPNRKYIMWHPGNFARNSEGCICMGDGLNPQSVEPMILNSQRTMDYFMERLEQAPPHELLIVGNNAWKEDLTVIPAWLQNEVLYDQR